MATFLTILLVIDVILLIILVVGLQHGNEGGMGAAFGAGNSAGFFGASGGVSFIVRATWIAASLFFALSLSLAWVKTREHFGVSREVNKILNESSIEPEATVVPVQVTPAATTTPVSGTPSATATPSQK